MDLDFSEEQQMLAELARDVCAEHCKVEVVRAAESDPKGYPLEGKIGVVRDWTSRAGTRIRAKLLADLKAIVARPGQNDRLGPQCFGNGSTHQSDRPRPSDQDIFSQQIERQRRMHRVSKRIEDRLDIARDLRVVVPDVALRQAQVFCESTRAVHPDPLGVRA